MRPHNKKAMDKPYPTRESGFYVLGLEARTSNALESNPQTAKIPGLWQQFGSVEFYGKVKHKLAKEKPFAIYHNYESDYLGAYSVTVGYQVPGLDDTPADLMGLRVPGGRYLMFTAEGNPTLAVPAAWAYIRDYFKQPGAAKRACTYDYEVYENPLRTSIFIAVQ